MAVHEIWEPLQCKTVFNTYLSLGRSNQKVEESGLAFFWPNWSSRDLPNPNTNTQIHKHANTQIHHMTKGQKDPICGIFLKRGLFKDIKNDIPMCQTCKYKKIQTQKNTYTKYTNRQIQHMTMHYWLRLIESGQLRFWNFVFHFIGKCHFLFLNN